MGNGERGIKIFVRYFSALFHDQIAYNRVPIPHFGG